MDKDSDADKLIDELAGFASEFRARISRLEDRMDVLERALETLPDGGPRAKPTKKERKPASRPPVEHAKPERPFLKR